MRSTRGEGDCARFGEICSRAAGVAGRESLRLRLTSRDRSNRSGKRREGARSSKAESLREITYRQALNESAAEELARDPNVFLMGEGSRGISRRL